jgi:hypothetical protein
LLFRLLRAAPVALVAIPSAGIPSLAQSQVDTIRPEMRRVDGKVQLGRRSGPIPVAGTWVVLHRIGHDRSGPLDSTRTNSSGNYDIRYPAFGDESAMYIAVASYRGIAYITSPLRLPRVTGDDAQIMVFDTTSPPYPIRVAGRHFVVTNPGEDGRRRVVEVYELMNDSTLTVLGSPGKPVWRTALPRDIADFQLNPQGDIAADNVKQGKEGLELFAPISPGIRQLSFSYTLPTSAFPLTVPMIDSVEVLEVLVAEPEAIVTGSGLTEVAPVIQEGGSFRRLLAQDVKQNTALEFTMPRHVASFAKKAVTRVAGGLAAAMVLALGWMLWRRRERRPRPLAIDPTESLVREIAALDADFEGRASPTDDDRVTFTAKRAALKTQLTTALGGQE